MAKASSPQTKFNMPREDLKELKGDIGDDKLDLSDLVGSWHACNQKTRSIVRVDLRKRGTGLTVQVFGSCHPNPCDWGVVKGIAYAESVSDTQAIAFTAVYDSGFKDAIVTGLLDRGSLIVETFNDFKDGSSRSNYYSRGYFCRRRRTKKAS